MNRRGWRLLVCAILLAFLPVSAASSAAAPKAGGILNATLIEAPPSFSIHDETTISAVWPMMPCYSNLVLFVPLKKQESLDTIIPELAEKWSWQEGGKSLAFSLRKDVKWHDGQPFTSKDVKYTFDTIREVEGVTAKLRVKPAQASQFCFPTSKRRLLDSGFGGSLNILPSLGLGQAH